MLSLRAIRSGADRGIESENRDVFRLALRGDLDEQPPNRWRIVPRRRIEAHAFDMSEIAARDLAEIILDEKAHGEPRRVGREAEHVKALSLS